MPRLDRLPYDRFLNFIWWWATREGDPPSIAKFKARLWQPPKGVVPEKGPWSPQAETAGLMALQAQLKQ